MCIYLNYHFFDKVGSTLHGLLVVNNENNSMIKIRLIDSTQACLGEGANDRDHLFSASAPPNYTCAYAGRGEAGILYARGLNGVQIRSRSE